MLRVNLFGLGPNHGNGANSAVLDYMLGFGAS